MKKEIDIHNYPKKLESALEMVKEAEKFEAQDKENLAKTQAKNGLENNLYNVSTSLSENEEKLKEIDEQLSVIRNKGRQIFLEKQPEHFSRILHDYSDEKKGFIIWKDLLEEQIV